LVGIPEMANQPVAKGTLDNINEMLEARGYKTQCSPHYFVSNKSSWEQLAGASKTADALLSGKHKALTDTFGMQGAAQFWGAAAEKTESGEAVEQGMPSRPPASDSVFEKVLNGPQKICYAPSLASNNAQDRMFIDSGEV
jgi:hypothetical protein